MVEYVDADCSCLHSRMIFILSFLSESRKRSAKAIQSIWNLMTFHISIMHFQFPFVNERVGVESEMGPDGGGC